MIRDKNGNILVEFICSCGAVVLARRNRVATKKFCSCSCPALKQKRVVSAVGKKFGEWTVIRSVPNTKDTGALYECQCSCGTIKLQRGGDLRYGTTSSCGHIKISLEEKKAKQATRCKNWYRTNPAKRHKSYRRARTPKWLSKKAFAEMNSIYQQAQQLTKETNIKYVVDHIVPLRGKNVSGLHVPWNLQVVPEMWNLKKSNRYAELQGDLQMYG